MGWKEIETSPDPDRPNQPTTEYELRSRGYVERTILQQLAYWDQERDEFGAAWEDGKPTWWFYRPVAALRDPSTRQGRRQRRDDVEPDSSLEATVRRALSRLQERGLLERHGHPDDGRQAMWNVTDDGVTEAAMLADAFATAQADLKKRYGVTDDADSVVGSAQWDWYYVDRHALQQAPED